MGSVLGGVGNAIGGVFGSIGGGAAEGAGAINQFQAQNPYSQAVLQDELNKQAQLYGDQQSLAQVLQAQMAGQGPNPAQTQYQQNVGANIANSQGLIASQRGLNPALAARMGANQATASNNQAALSSALLQQQQQLAATSNLGNLYGQIQQGNLGQQQLYTQANQGAAGINQNTAGQNAQVRGQLAGSLIQGAAGAGAAAAKGGAAHGGVIPGKATVPGDSPANDTVDMSLSPGEIVIPRSMAHSPEASKAFIEALFKNQASESDGGYGEVLKAKGLKKKTDERLKMFDGGLVGSEEETTDNTVLPDKYYRMQGPESENKSFMESLGIGTFKADPYGLESAQAQPVAVAEPAIREVASQEPILTTAPVEQVPVAQPTEQGMDADYAKNVALKESAITGLADSQAKASQEQAKVYEQQAAQIADQQKRYQEEHTRLDVEHKQIVDAIKNDKIDPNRFLGNMNTGNKILAAISVGLSGLGAGLQGPGAKNLAMEIIQKNIDRDIEAQKMELGKKQTLLSENVKRYGDLNTATQMTQLQMNAMVQAKISQIAAKSGSAEAAARAKMGLSELGLQAAAIKEKVAQQRALSQGNITDANVQSFPKEVRETLVKIGGKYERALDADSAKKAREIVGTNDAMMGNLDKLISLREKYGAETVPGPAKAEMQSLAANLQLSIKEAKKLGTLDKGAEKFLERLVADPTSVGFVADQYKALKASQLRETSQMLKSLGVNAGSDYKESPEIKTMNGVKYQKVQGGWQKVQ